MKVGGYHIKGISPRFWIILSLPIILVFVWFFFLRGGSDINPDPVVPLENLSQLTKNKDWVNNYLQGSEPLDLANQNEIAGLVDPVSYTAATVTPAVYQFKAYLPAASEEQGGSGQLYRNDLTRKVTLGGQRWVMNPAVVVDSSVRIDTTALQEAEASQEGQPVVLMTPAAEAPPAGVFLVTALLEYHTASPFFQDLPKTAESDSEAQTSPIFLVANMKPLQAAELSAETTQFLPLNLSYRQGPLSLRIKNIEWSVNKQVRVCLSLQNTSRSATPNWIGATDPAMITAEASQASAPSAGEYIRDSSATAGQTASPLLVDTLPGLFDKEDVVGFGAAAAQPENGLILRMPPLKANVAATTSDSTNEIKITIKPEQIREYKANDVLPSCGGNTASSTTAP